MDIKSCYNCGVVLDISKFNLSHYLFIDEDDLTINTDTTEWNGETYVKCIFCPVCNTKIETENPA